MIKNYIFDMGNVLLSFDDDYLLSVYLDNDKDRKFVHKELIHSEEWARADRGDISEEELLESVLKRMPDRLKKSAREIYLNWHLLMKPIKGAKEYVEQLKNDGKNVYVLSNAPLRFAELEKIHSDMFSLFDGIVVSARERTVKPEDKIYQILLSRYSLNPAECYFYDDLEANVEGARRNGIDGEIFKGDFTKYLREKTDEK